MKYLIVLFVLPFFLNARAQESLTGIKAPVTINSTSYFGDIQLPDAHQVNLNIPVTTNLLAIASEDGYFHRTYSMNKEGETISSGFMPSPYFMPNNNLLVITGKHYKKRDSYNPYGAGDLAEWIFLGTVNNFISRIKLGRR